MLQEDVILIEQAKKDKQAFGLLYAKHKGTVYGYILKRVDFDKETAEDLQSETFTRALEHLDHFAPTGNSYLSYLLTIAHNILVNYYRVKRPVPFNECEDILVESEEELIENAETHYEAEAVAHAIHLAPPQEARLLSLRYEDGMSIKHIAQVTHRSPNAVKLALCRCRKKLIDNPALSFIGAQLREEMLRRARQLVLW